MTSASAISNSLAAHDLAANAPRRSHRAFVIVIVLVALLVGSYGGLLYHQYRVAHELCRFENVTYQRNLARDTVLAIAAKADGQPQTEQTWKQLERSVPKPTC